jgi:hypothetical protein
LQNIYQVKALKCDLPKLLFLKYSANLRSKESGNGGLENKGVKDPLKINKQIEYSIKCITYKTTLSMLLKYNYLT